MYRKVHHKWEQFICSSNMIWRATSRFNSLRIVEFFFLLADPVVKVAVVDHGPHIDLAQVLCWLPFLMQPHSFCIGLGTGTQSPLACTISLTGVLWTFWRFGVLSREEQTAAPRVEGQPVYQLRHRHYCE